MIHSDHKEKLLDYMMKKEPQLVLVSRQKTVETLYNVL